jgi:hypothetical protein
LDAKQAKKLNQAIYKKALGYKSEETVKEYVKNSEGEMELVKQKTSTKHNAPDINAAKIVLEWVDVADDYVNMSIQQLQQERQKLIEIYQSRHVIQEE